MATNTDILLATVIALWSWFLPWIILCFVNEFLFFVLVTAIFSFFWSFVLFCFVFFFLLYSVIPIVRFSTDFRGLGKSAWIPQKISVRNPKIRKSIRWSLPRKKSLRTRSAHQTVGCQIGIWLKFNGHNKSQRLEANSHISAILGWFHINIIFNLSPSMCSLTKQE